MATMTGRCLCGQVRYTVTGDPAFSGICHCRNCQRYTGSAFETIVAFPTEAIKVQGELKTYQDTGDSGQPVFRRFCAKCGSGVIADVNVLPSITLVLAGTLDDPAAFLTHFGSRALEFAAMRNANLTVFSYRNNGWNESP